MSSSSRRVIGDRSLHPKKPPFNEENRKRKEVHKQRPDLFIGLIDSFAEPKNPTDVNQGLGQAGTVPESWEACPSAKGEIHLREHTLLASAFYLPQSDSCSELKLQLHFPQPRPLSPPQDWLQRHVTCCFSGAPFEVFV